MQLTPLYRSTLVAALLGSLLAGGSAHGAPDVVGTRATGMGEAVRASASGLSGPTLNPAGMSLTRTYVIGALYQFRSSDSASQTHVSVVDSRTTRVAAGLYYDFVHATPDLALPSPDGTIEAEQTHRAHEVGLSLSVPLGNWLLLGFSNRYINYKVSLPEELSSLSGRSISDVTMDVGGIVRLGRWFSVGIVGYNLIPVEDQLYPQSLGLGVALTSGPSLTAGFDSVIDFTSDPDGVSTSLHGGAEFLLANRYALRGGVQHHTYWKTTHITAGVGIIAPRIGLEFGLRQQVDGGKGTLASFALQLYLP